MSAEQPANDTPSRSVAFQVGIHQVEVACRAGRWIATLDGVAFEQWFMSQAAAWEAAVRKADLLDRPAR